MLPDFHPFRIFIMIVPASLLVSDCASSPSPVETTHRSECFTASLVDLETSSRSTQMMVPFPTSETALRISPGYTDLFSFHQSCSPCPHSCSVFNQSSKS